MVTPQELKLLEKMESDYYNRHDLIGQLIIETHTRYVNSGGYPEDSKETNLDDYL